MLTLIVTVIFILFIIMLIIKRFFYFRPSYEFHKPLDTYQDVQIGNLHAWYKEGKNGKIVFFCHGQKGNISHTQEKIINFLKMGHGILTFDYSGYGQSRGVPNEDMCYSNADTYMFYLLRNGYDKDNIIAYGEDLGCAVATYVAKKYSLPRLVLENAFPRIGDLISKKYSVITSVIFPEFNTESFLKSYRGSTLLIDSSYNPLSESLRKYCVKYISPEEDMWKNINIFI
jgi:uncharacterized protein